MNKIWIVVLVSLFIASGDALLAQKSESTQGNFMKVNLSGFIFRNISVEYERKTGERTSFAFNFHTIPFGKLPFQSLAQKLIDKAYVDLNLAEVGNTGATASYRFFRRKKGVFNGFYFAPMVTYNSYKTALPIQYNNGKTGFFTGNIHAVTGGIQAGVECRLSGKLYLDIWLLGPSYGFSSGNLRFDGPLSINEQAILSAEIEDLKGSLPIYVISSYQVNSTGASIVEQGPWAGLRGLGINLGFRF